MKTPSLEELQQSKTIRWCPDCSGDQSMSAHCDHDKSILIERLQPGFRIAAKYDVLSILGVGGMGVVYKCRDLYMDRLVAIKMLASEHNVGNQYTQNQVIRFQQEARAAGKFQHPNLVSILDFGISSDGAPYMAMEYVEGKMLSDAFPLGDSEKSGGSQRLLPLLEVFIQCCEGLAYAHKLGVLHRDLKPANIMVVGEGDKTTAKILDFGAAKILDLSQMFQTKSGLLFGTPPYMSPEQTNGGTADRRSDVYALGCVLYECLTGTRPCFGRNAMETFHKHQVEIPRLINDVGSGFHYPLELQDLVARALAKNPEDRPQSMDEFKDELKRVCAVVKTAGKQKLALIKKLADMKGKRAAAIVASSSLCLAATAIILAGQNIHDAEQNNRAGSGNYEKNAIHVIENETPEKYRDSIALKKLAEAGDPEAQFWLGRSYARGGKYDEALQCYLRAAKKGNSSAQAELGQAYLEGLSGSEKKNEAINWFRLAARQNNSKGLYQLGLCYYHGNGVKQDYSRAVELFEKSGSSDALACLAYMHELGSGVGKNEVEAARLYKLAAGNVASQVQLGGMYADGRGVNKDYSQALHWYKKAANEAIAKQSDLYPSEKKFITEKAAFAEYRLGQFYENGQGVPRQFATAKSYYQKALYHGLSIPKQELTRLESKHFLP